MIDQTPKYTRAKTKTKLVAQLKALSAQEQRVRVSLAKTIAKHSR